MIRPSRSTADEETSEGKIGWTFLPRPYWGSIYNAVDQAAYCDMPSDLWQGAVSCWPASRVLEVIPPRFSRGSFSFNLTLSAWFTLAARASPGPPVDFL